MLEALKDDHIIRKVGGRFKLSSLIQKRWAEILQGSRPLVKREAGMSDLDVIIQEILQDKVAIDYENSDVPHPDELD